MTLAWVLERFQNVHKAGSAWTEICPAHDDQHSSLSISEGDDGKILLKCHAGCSTKAIIDGAGLTWRDLFPGAANN